MKLPFSKMHALGNDFVVVNVCEQGNVLTSSNVKKMADRHFGIGCDQLLAIAPSTAPKADFDYWIFNADGGRVYQCGNGARCLARYAIDHGMHDGPMIRFYTGRDILEVTRLDEENYQLKLPVPHAIESHFEVEVEAQTIQGVFVDIGNPHFIIFSGQQVVDQAHLAEQLQKHARFPHSVNVSYARVESDHLIKLRVFERGAGETLACGSGAAASAIAAQSLGLCAQKVNIDQAGGRLKVEWRGEGEPVLLTGGASHVFDGDMDL